MSGTHYLFLLKHQQVPIFILLYKTCFKVKLRTLLGCQEWNMWSYKDMFWRNTPTPVWFSSIVSSIKIICGLFPIAIFKFIWKVVLLFQAYILLKINDLNTLMNFSILQLYTWHCHTSTSPFFFCSSWELQSASSLLSVHFIPDTKYFGNNTLLFT